MSELSNLTGGARSDVLPGYVLSKLGLAEYGECEDEFGRKYIATVALGVSKLPAESRKEWIDIALAKVATGQFNWGRPEFDRQSFASSHLTFLLYVCLKVHHGDITRQKAASLLTSENEGNVQRAVLEKMGYRFGEDPKNDLAEAKKEPSTGEPSSSSSAKEESSTGIK